MSTEVTVAVVAGTLTLLGGGVLAVLNSAISRRSGIDDVLRVRRLEVYPRLWALTGTFSRWPQQTVSRSALEDLHGRLRGWYYGEGGLFLSERARARYGDLQDLVGTVLAHRSAPSAVVSGTRYVDLCETASALRSAMTEDLDTRSRSTRSERRRREQWHAGQAVAAQLRRTAAAADDAAFAAADQRRS
jgi:hypothetical protein